MSSNSLIFITETNKVYYCGMHLKFQPEKFPLEMAANKIFATYDSVGIIGADSKVYYLNDKIIDDSDEINGVMVIDDEKMNGNVVDMGGLYKLRYAIINQ
eukprot:GHVR01052384.1.p4 GENE.GHVR01052384.1~~GHVR01052384.1.p4  ORF type:complete len:100 (+),score=6.00 GHVR01052384.1:3222-3521(+)